MNSSFQLNSPEEKSLKLCTKCLLPETFPNITLDNQGVCNYCLDYKDITYLGEKALEDIFVSNRHPEAKYDCIVPVSGGRDSAFVLHQIANKFNLKALAFNYDSGFATKQAKKNISNLVNKLNVNLVTRKSKNNIQVRLMKENAKLNSSFSTTHILKDLCNGCSNGYKGGAFQLAKEKEIPLIIFGDSKMEKSVYKKEIFKGIEFSKKAKIRNACYKPLNFMKRRYYNHLLEKEFPFAGEDNEPIQVVHFFDYIKWDEKQIEEAIKNLGWTSGSMETTWRMDCKVHALVDFLTYKIFGYNEKDEMYSKMIREGKIDRNTALQKLDALRVTGNDAGKIMDFLDEYDLNHNEIRNMIGV